MEPGSWDRVTRRIAKVTAWNGGPQRVRAPCNGDSKSGGIPSSTSHGKPGANLGGPPSKAKYYSATDNEPVARANDEKNRKDRS